jgi:PDZ domain/Aspartyl protease
MFCRLIQLFILFFLTFSWSQSGFEIQGKKNIIKIPFKLVNNLVIIPIEVNGTKLNFLLDTGVSETLLFSLDETEQVNFEKIEKVKFSGLGNNESFDGLKSSKNRVSCKDFTDNNHTIYIVLDQNINISSQVGFPINGIIGYHFFKNHPIEIKYKKNKIIVYNSSNSISTKTKKKYRKTAISIEERKPYIYTNVVFENEVNELVAKVLIDTGNSDALWLFREKNANIKTPEKTYLDFLGKGFGGNIYGDRGRLKSFELGGYTFNNPLISFPDSTATKGIEMVNDRVGSIGSEIMNRFNTLYDYQNNLIYLEKNDNFILPFNFNMSGLDIQHEGLQWVKEAYDLNSTSTGMSFESGDERITRGLKYKFFLRPSYSILSIRKDSPADVSGLKEGDVLIKLNGNFIHNYKLEDINNILKSEEGRTIYIEVERKGVSFKTKFKLQKVI